ncbi:MAG: YfhO family protein [Flavobacteriaceae bacterium]|jgi:hypothetical protein|nr:YfhO family protein [Flavobacteriaceae bacterium]
MMKNPVLRFLLPHSLVTVLFVVISLAYFYPLLSNKYLEQSDIVQYKGMQRQILEHRAEFDEEPYWIDNAFVGMPTYQITSRYPYDVLRYVDAVLRFLPRPADMLFLYLFFFYLFAQSRRFSVPVSVVGALAYGFSSYYIVILMVGHNTKAMVLAYAPLVFLGLFQVLFDRKKWGILWLTFGLALQLHANHLQMTYYTLVMVFIISLMWSIYSWYKHSISSTLKPVFTILVSGMLALVLNAQSVLATLDYTKFSTRGSSELTINPDGSDKVASDGLSFDYITSYSYGILESMTFISPNIMGGSSSEGFADDSPFMQFIKAKLGDGSLDYDTAVGLLRQFRPYWGDQPFVAAPVYLGVVVVFFALLGLVVTNRNTRLVLLSIIAVSLLFSWGKNTPEITQFFIDYFPLYSKFRAVSSAQIMIMLCVPYAAMLGLQYLTQGMGITRKKLVNVYGVVVFFITIILFLIGGAKGFFSFTSTAEGMSNLPNVLLEPIQASRKLFVWDDVWHIITYLSLIVLALFALWRKLFSGFVFSVVIAIIAMADLWQYNRLFFNAEQFKGKYQYDYPFDKTAQDKSILKDDSTYRVFEPRLGFSSSRTAYFHNSLGGYHGAKPALLQDVYDFYLKQQDSVVLDMLNVKFIIDDQYAEGMKKRPSALGPVWFVDEVVQVASANEAILKLNKIDPKTQALSQTITSVEYTPVETDTISLIEKRNNLLRYTVSTTHERLAVFSEMYYPSGWSLEIDGTLQNYHKVNYMLRGIVVPPGKHEIVFSFEPTVIRNGTLLMASGWVLFLLMIGVLMRQQKESKLG